MAGKPRPAEYNQLPKMGVFYQFWTGTKPEMLDPFRASVSSINFKGRVIQDMGHMLLIEHEKGFKTCIEKTAIMCGDWNFKEVKK